MQRFVEVGKLHEELFPSQSIPHMIEPYAQQPNVID